VVVPAGKVMKASPPNVTFWFAKMADVMSVRPARLPASEDVPVADVLPDPPPPQADTSEAQPATRK
jgi:hypothetical protein